LRRVDLGFLSTPHGAGLVVAGIKLVEVAGIISPPPEKSKQLTEGAQIWYSAKPPQKTIRGFVDGWSGDSLRI